jgi:glycosyltransferase involved in cell wall biosynthesis
MTNLVSILIPAYNAGARLRETVKSALGQTWTHKEVIIVDDGSKDDTLQIAREFESTTVKVVTQANKGAAAARNTARSLAQGGYIQWLDADDLLAPDKIAQQLRDGAESGPQSRVLLTAPFGTFFYRYQNAKYRPNALWQDLTPLDWMKVKFRDNAWMNPASWLVTRTLTESAGPWDERLSLDDDGEYLCRLVLASERVHFVPSAQCYYRVGQFGSLSRRRSEAAYQSLLLATVTCIDHLLSLANDEETRAACIMFLENRLWHFHPEKTELIEELNSLARRLGTSELQLRETRRYLLTGKLLGWYRAKRLRNVVFGTTVWAQRNIDRLQHTISGRDSN